MSDSSVLNIKFFLLALLRIGHDKKKGKKSLVTAEFSGFADIFEGEVFDKDGDQLRAYPQGSNQSIGEFPDNPALLIGGCTLFHPEYDYGHGGSRSSIDPAV